MCSIEKGIDVLDFRRIKIPFETTQFLLCELVVVTDKTGTNECKIFQWKFIYRSIGMSRFESRVTICRFLL